jgi:drug/metabolite transporter (DMT)-like permease
LLRIYLILVSGIIVASASAIIIRWTGDVPFTVISFYRVFISFCLLLLYQILNPKIELKKLSHFHWHYLLAGVFLAAHFITWIASLQMTSIANSIFLESLHPLFAVVLSIIFLKESPHQKTYPLFVLAIIGMFIIVSTDFNQPGTKLIGDFLAIISALCFACYILIARKHKAEQNFIKYLTYIYGSASLTCAIYIIFSGAHFLGYSVQSWSLMILLAVGPNLYGHSILNWASRHIEIFKVNLMLLLEPLLATLMGIFFIAEYPPQTFYIGAGLILLSLWFLIYLESRGENSCQH